MKILILTKSNIIENNTLSTIEYKDNKQVEKL